MTFGYKMATLLAASSVTANVSTNCGHACWSANSAAPPARWPRSAAGGMEMQAGLMKELGLGQPVIAWHTVRDSIAEVGCFLGLVAGTLGKISIDVKLMMQTEVEEVYEPFTHGRGSSQHHAAEAQSDLVRLHSRALNSVVRQHVAALLDAMVEDHERSTGPWEIEWIVLPEIFCLTAGALGADALRP